MMDIRVRAARTDEIDQIYAVHRDSVSTLCTSHYTDAQIASWLDGRSPAMYLPAIADRRLWVADDGDLVGFVEISGHELTKLFIRGDRASGGIGRKLLATAVEAIRESGAQSVYLEATSNARAFYARHGFGEIGRGEFSHGATGNALEVVKMELDLRQKRL
jgi:putative acetyltransferase